MGNQVRNTATADPLINLLDTAGPGGIERQEAVGQYELVNSDVLPSEIHGDKSILEAAGVVFGEPVEGDPLFTNVTLPEGWRKVATDHSMHSDLVDADGKKRASIFYKAAHYDRRADMMIAEA